MRNVICTYQRISYNRCMFIDSFSSRPIETLIVLIQMSLTTHQWWLLSYRYFPAGHWSNWVTWISCEKLKYIFWCKLWNDQHMLFCFYRERNILSMAFGFNHTMIMYIVWCMVRHMYGSPQFIGVKIQYIPKISIRRLLFCIYCSLFLFKLIISFGVIALFMANNTEKNELHL